MGELKLKIKEVIEQKIYRNEQLKKALEHNFSEDELRTAWMTVQIIKELYPEFSEKLNGKLIYENITEE